MTFTTILILTVATGYLLGITVPFHSEAASFENRLTDYLIRTLVPPFRLDFSYQNDKFHTIFIHEDFYCAHLLQRFDSDLFRFSLADEEYVIDFNPDIVTSFSKLRNTHDFGPAGTPSDSDVSVT